MNHSVIVGAFAPVPPFLAAQAVIVIQAGIEPRRIALPCVRFPPVEANRLGWRCVGELETVEARRRFREGWNRVREN